MAVNVISPISATASSIDFSARDSQYAINGDGLTAEITSTLTGFTHNNIASNYMWNTVGRGSDNSPFIIFDLGNAYNISELYLWNFNENLGAFGSFTGFGMKDVNVSAGLSQDSLINIGTYMFSQANGTPDYAGEIIIMPISNVRYVKFEPLNTWSGTIFGSNYSTPPGDEGRGITGLSEVKFGVTNIPEPSSSMLWLVCGTFLFTVRLRRRG